MTPYLIIGTESSPIRKETQEITFQRFEDSKDFGNTFFSFLKKKKKNQQSGNFWPTTLHSYPYFR